MIIFGTRGITSTAEEGDFFCPACDSQRWYERKRVRRFFTLYFVPLIPLNVVGEFVECGACEGTFQTEVLEYDPEEMADEFRAEFERGVLRVMAEMALADGRVDPDEITALCDLQERVTGVRLSPDEMSEEVEEARMDDRDLREYLSELAYSLNSAGKETVVKVAFLVAAADSEMRDEEEELLAELGATLDMTPAHVRGVIQTMVAG